MSCGEKGPPRRDCSCPFCRRPVIVAPVKRAPIDHKFLRPPGDF